MIDDDRVPSHPTYTLCKRPLLHTIRADLNLTFVAGVDSISEHIGEIEKRLESIEVPLADVPQKSPR